MKTSSAQAMLINRRQAIRSIMLCTGLLLLCLTQACSPQTQTSAQVPHPLKQKQWQALSSRFFLADYAQTQDSDNDEGNKLLTAALNAEDLAQGLYPLIKNAAKIKDEEYVSQSSRLLESQIEQGIDQDNERDEALHVSAEDTVLLHALRALSSEQGAKRERLLKRIQLYLSMQYLSYKAPMLSEGSGELMTKHKEVSDYLQSLTSFIESSQALQEGEFTIYEADAQRALFAFSRVHKKARAFVAFNLSFDTHDMPLPFGFMASTKITQWRSDTQSASTFVTDRPLTIAPFTMVIILVGY